VLKVFEKLTEEMEGAHYVTLSLVPQRIHELLHIHLATDEEYDPPLLHKFKKALYESTMKRFGHVINSITLASLAAAVDPRTGDLSCLPENLQEAVWEQIEKEACQLLVPTALPDELLSDQPPTLTLTNEAVKHLIRAVHDLFQNKAHRSTLGKVNPLKLWSEQCSFAALAPFVRMLLGIPASNASAERSFSSAGFISQRRENLSIHTLEQMSIIRHHLLQGESESEREALFADMIESLRSEN